jgi:hypothetical protein
VRLGGWNHQRCLLRPKPEVADDAGDPVVEAADPVQGEGCLDRHCPAPLLVVVLHLDVEGCVGCVFFFTRDYHCERQETRENKRPHTNRARNRMTALVNNPCGFHMQGTGELIRFFSRIFRSTAVSLKCLKLKLLMFLLDMMKQTCLSYRVNFSLRRSIFASKYKTLRCHRHSAFDAIGGEFPDFITKYRQYY